MLEIIQASEEHFPIVQRLAYQIWPHTFKEILSPEQIAYMLEWMYSLTAIHKHVYDDGAVFLLVKDSESNEFMGFASYKINYQKEPKTKLHKIYVHPACQGKGMGMALIKRVEEIALENSNYTVSLNVNRFNKALDFYQKIGFSIVKQEDIDIGKGFLMEDYVMEKKL